MSDLSRETRHLLELGREGVPLSLEHRARLKGSVLARIAAASLATTATSAAALSIGKVVGVVLLVGMAGAATNAAVTWRAAHPAPHPVKLEPLTPSHPSHPSDAAPIAPSTAAEAVAQNAPPSTRPRLRARSVQDVAKTQQQVQTVEPAVASFPLDPAPDAPQVKPVAPAVPVAPLLHGSVESLAAEAGLLRNADAALKAGDAAGCLRILEELATRFPNGSLAPERSAERVFALCRAGRTSDARREAGVFLRNYPEGPLASRVRASCGAGAP